MTNYDLLSADIDTLSAFIGALQMGVSCASCPGNPYCQPKGWCKDAIKNYLSQDVTTYDSWLNGINEEMPYKLLEIAYQRTGKITILVDFDENIRKATNKNRTKTSLLLKEFVPYACISFIATDIEETPQIIEYLKAYNIPYDSISFASDKQYSNIKDNLIQHPTIEFTGNKHSYLNSKNFDESYECLSKLLTAIKNNEISYENGENQHE